MRVHEYRYMTSSRRLAVASLTIGFAVIVSAPSPAFAGMPSYTLNDFARMRVQSISFFLLLFFASAGVVMVIWNLLRRDFVRLPRLRYWRSLAMVSIWGLLFLLVLTMISGARELMTPSAWEKQGATYRLTEPPAPTETDRRAQLLALKNALWQYATQHEGELPPDDRGPHIPAATWEAPDITRARYLYLPGRKVGDSGAIVAYEPRLMGSPRLVLTADGQIRAMTDREIDAAIQSAADTGGLR